MENCHLREAKVFEIDQLIDVFKSSIVTAASGDYSADEIKEWLRSTENSERWLQLFEEQLVLVAVINESIVGFATLQTPGYIDFMYVHGDYQQKGIAQLLFEEIKRTAIKNKVTILSSDVSITAKPFFAKNGFKVVRENQHKRGSQVLVNYHMVCDIATV